MNASSSCSGVVRVVLADRVNEVNGLDDWAASGLAEPESSGSGMKAAGRMRMELPRMEMVLLLRIVVGEKIRRPERERRRGPVAKMRVWEGRRTILKS